MLFLFKNFVFKIYMEKIFLLQEMVGALAPPCPPFFTALSRLFHSRVVSLLQNRTTFVAKI